MIVYVSFVFHRRPDTPLNINSLCIYVVATWWRIDLFVKKETSLSTQVQKCVTVRGLSVAVYSNLYFSIRFSKKKKKTDGHKNSVRKSPFASSTRTRINIVETILLYRNVERRFFFFFFYRKTTWLNNCILRDPVSDRLRFIRLRPVFVRALPRRYKRYENQFKNRNLPRVKNTIALPSLFSDVKIT